MDRITNQDVLIHVTSLPPVQSVFTVIRLCIASQITHLLRSVPPAATKAAATRLDLAVVDTVLRIMKLGHIDVNDPQWLHSISRIMLPTRLGGSSILSSARAVDPAYVGSIALVAKTIVTNVPSVAGSLDVHVVGFADAKTRLKDLDLKDAPVPTTGTIITEPVQKLQASLYAALVSARYDEILRLLPDPANQPLADHHARTLMLSCTNSRQSDG